jgi:formylglycine-generating enzyme required for sulfatase activity
VAGRTAGGLWAATLVLGACASPFPTTEGSGLGPTAGLSPSFALRTAVDAAAPFLPDPPSVATAAPCPDDMAWLPNACIDRYEAPNVKGATPFTMRTAADGEAWCAERGKRLCTEAEWVRACEGSTGRRFPYGNAYDANTCNDHKTWVLPHWDILATYPSPAAQREATRLLQADPSGAHGQCVSEDGVYDLTGNVAEWVARSYPSSTGYDHLLKGCFWVGCKRDPHPSCDYRNIAHQGGFRTYEAGFRCCRARDT